ncbi:hypothetical protein [Agrobacterium larrymoorei]|uniref:Uncharacterized protein n=1 Tax=Agrobacterium larrymoorei TaxID=160699 RepID=A0AAF0H8J3_9HYPH|nr:hypothetical protein [Agrobacterium larrymoorei]QYA06943.1 hypothetical protein J5285_13095 [Agrobacterium larrymoorei]WHA42334.1 hypothetical protein CFBP5477_006850 [Agrobacterium larrymoorei]
MAPFYAALVVFFALWTIQVALKKLFNISLNTLAFALLAGAVSFIAFSFV